jgi:hypothetical protein
LHYGGVFAEGRVSFAAPENFVTGRSELRRQFFTFPEPARWSAERQAVEFEVEIGEYRGLVRVPRRVFQRLL